MLRRLASVLCGSLLALLVFGASAAPAPEFRLGFAALAGQIPEVVGQPLENEHYGANGDSLQATTTGLMAWRKADNWTAFTDGATTWINGPAGVVSRPNWLRFPWEGNTQIAAPSPAPQPLAPTPTPAPHFYTPDVKAMDPESGGPGVMVKQTMAEIDVEWARVWGWRPRKPATVYLFNDGYRLVDGMPGITGETVPPEQRTAWARTTAGYSSRDVQTGGWAVLMNLSDGRGSPSWEILTKDTLIHEYGHVIQSDVAGDPGPVWYSEGLAQLGAYVKVPSSPSLAYHTAAVRRAKAGGTLPTLRQLQANWDGFDASVSYGASYLAVRYLADRFGGAPLLDVLKHVAGGEGFEPALQAVTGYTLERLDAEYRKTIP